MSRLEINIPDWDQLVNPIVRAWESEEAQRAVEEKRLVGIQSARELATAKEVKTMLEATRTQTWDLLNGFNPKELLEGLNRSRGVWRHMGTIQGIEFNPKSVAYHLDFAFPNLTFYPGSSGGEGDPKLASYIVGTRSTSLRIGVVHSKEKRIGGDYDNSLHWENNQNFQGEGYGLYVYNSDANLNSVEGADTFKDVQPNLGYMVANSIHKGRSSKWADITPLILNNL
ncbi:hypothetical protein A3H40_03735 [Candidatus Daviesbacteria bacterium RIFCSPLOWO2_02_FULL_38_15]|uniref:Uncharacterized protein n=1 Tax=Candidatus Daviesbacteria bacterium RIFCSPLOWO2_02_FULL_38_15 TaxID=1797794 RepID=A0A1F5N0Z8_9BACT|nr:MAG: hypothetical protein A3H40_03735 [Candidatus Daviesbacteria bacterium RIFCSPLOWO2_02_FULL_38_15]